MERDALLTELASQVAVDPSDGDPPERGSVPSLAVRERGRTDELLRQCYSLGYLRVMMGLGDSTSLELVKRISRVPHAPDLVLGLVNVRGRVMPLIDQASLFKVQRTSGAAKYMLITESTNGPAALLVDGIPTTLRIPASAKITPPLLPQAIQPALLGVYEHEGCQYLDVDHSQLMQTLMKLMVEA